MECASGSSRTSYILSAAARLDPSVLMERVFDLGRVVSVQQSTQSFLFSETKVLEAVLFHKAVVGFEDRSLITRPVPLQVEPS